MPTDYSDTRFEKNFFERQAQENAASSILKGPVGFVLLLVLLGVAYGAFKAVEYFINIDKNTAMKYVELVVENPNLRSGQAIIDVKVNNWNPVELKTVTLRYNIEGTNGRTVSDGTVTIPHAVPAGDIRTFRSVRLGELSAPAARMHAELSDVTIGEKSNLQNDQALHFIEIGALKEAEKLEALKAFVKDAPGFAPGHVALGIAYENANDRQRAEAAYRKAVEADPENANAHLHLGRLLVSTDRAEAAAEIEKAKAKMPYDPAVQEALTFVEPVAAEK